MMNFGVAIAAMKQGNRVQRVGWNGKGMWVAIQGPYAGSPMDHPYIFMSTVDGTRIPWLASQADMLAVDWASIGPEEKAAGETPTE